MTKAELNKKAQETMKLNKAKECYVCSDGNVFLNKNMAEHHAKTLKLKLEKVKLEAKEAELKNSETNKAK